MGDLAVDRVVQSGIGLVQAQHANNLFDAMHSYLADAGITGITFFSYFSASPPRARSLCLEL
jgi:hypothetical protein